MTYTFGLSALLFTMVIGLTPLAHAEETVILGGRYVGNQIGKTNFNNADNKNSAYPAGPTIAEDARRQYQANREAYTKNREKPVMKTKPQRSAALPQLDEKKLRCASGNYDDCR